MSANLVLTAEQES